MKINKKILVLIMIVVGVLPLVFGVPTGVTTPSHEYLFEQNGNDNIGSVDWSDDNGFGMTYNNPSFINEGSYHASPSTQGFYSTSCNTDWTDKSISVWLRPNWTLCTYPGNGSCVIFQQIQAESWKAKDIYLRNNSNEGAYYFSGNLFDGTAEYVKANLSSQDNATIVNELLSPNGFLFTLTASSVGSNGRARIYLNDHFVAETVIDGNLNGVLGDCSILYQANNDDVYFYGDVDLFRIWNSHELNQSEVQLLWEEYGLDTTPPTINSITLSSTSVSTNDIIQVNVSCSDDRSVDFIYLSTNITGTWQNVSGYDCSGSPCQAVFDYTADTSGSGQFRASCTDTSGNDVVSDSSEFEVASISNDLIITDDSETDFNGNAISINDYASSHNWTFDGPGTYPSDTVQSEKTQYLSHPTGSGKALKLDSRPYSDGAGGQRVYIDLSNHDFDLNGPISIEADVYLTLLNVYGDFKFCFGEIDTSANYTCLGTSGSAYTNYWAYNAKGTGLSDTTWSNNLNEWVNLRATYNGVNNVSFYVNDTYQGSIEWSDTLMSKTDNKLFARVFCGDSNNNYDTVAYLDNVKACNFEGDCDDDTTPPTINSITLSSTSVSTNDVIQINVSCSDNVEVDFINLSTNITGTWQNVSGYDCSSASCLAVFDYTADTVGHGQFRGSCTDTSSNNVVSGSSVFTVTTPAPSYADETSARTAIETGIANALTSGYSLYTDQPIYLRSLTNEQDQGSFDKFVKKDGKAWAFNYISNGESYEGMFNLTPVLYILEMSEMTSSEITTTVENLISGTK